MHHSFIKKYHFGMPPFSNFVSVSVLKVCFIFCSSSSRTSQNCHHNNAGMNDLRVQCIPPCPALILTHVAQTSHILHHPACLLLHPAVALYLFHLLQKTMHVWVYFSAMLLHLLGKPFYYLALSVALSLL